jgi:hypothetical protein
MLIVECRMSGYTPLEYLSRTCGWFGMPQDAQRANILHENGFPISMSPEAAYGIVDKKRNVTGLYYEGTVGHACRKRAEDGQAPEMPIELGLGKYCGVAGKAAVEEVGYRVHYGSQRSKFGHYMKALPSLSICFR